MRISWPDGTDVSVHFTDRGTSKSRVAVQHRKLRDAEAVARAKAAWAGRFDTLDALLDEGGD